MENKKYKVMLELEEGIMEIDTFETKEEALKCQKETIETFYDYKQCWIEMIK